MSLGYVKINVNGVTIKKNNDSTMNSIDEQEYCEVLTENAENQDTR